jgi:hypothetical protein
MVVFLSKLQRLIDRYFVSMRVQDVSSSNKLRKKLVFAAQHCFYHFHLPNEEAALKDGGDE